MRYQHLLLIAGLTLMLLITSCNLSPEAAEDCKLQTQISGTKLRWYDGSTLVYVPEGKFLMGDGGEDSPIHEVYLDDFWIYKTKVTNGMYGLCVAAGYCNPPGPDPTLPDYTAADLKDRPVVGVTWTQAERYCAWMRGSLPTEAEWEKTARSTDGRTYPWGEERPDCDLLNFDACVGRLTDVLDYPAGASPFGAFDFSGNAFEWVFDWYQATYYTESPTDNPGGPESGEVRSVRGSAFDASLEQVRPSLRRYSDPEVFRADLGFRCVVADAQCFAPPCEISPTVGEPNEPDGAPEGTTCEPPQADVKVGTYCQKKEPYVTLNPQGAELTLPDGVDCDLVGEIYVCTGDEGGSFEIEVCTSCLPPPPENQSPTPSCPDGYTFDETSCTCKSSGLSDGFGTDCLDLYIDSQCGKVELHYDSESQCCQIEWPEIGFGPANPYCEPGYVPEGCLCVGKLPPLQEVVTACETLTVTLPVCNTDHKVCREQYCRPPAAWDSDLCCCASGGVCQ